MPWLVTHYNRDRRREDNSHESNAHAKDVQKDFAADVPVSTKDRFRVISVAEFPFCVFGTAQRSWLMLAFPRARLPAPPGGGVGEGLDV